MLKWGSVLLIHHDANKVLLPVCRTAFIDDFSFNWMAQVRVSTHSAWPSDTIWRHWTRSKLAQVMACCLMAKGHYLNNVHFSLVRFCSIPLRAISQRADWLLFWIMILKIIHVLLKLLPHLPKANDSELNLFLTDSKINAVLSSSTWLASESQRINSLLPRRFKRNFR